MPGSPSPTIERKKRRARTTKAERVGEILDRERKDSSDSLEALRLQAKAWRLLTIISLADRERGLRETHWLIMNSFPWINAVGLRAFIAEREVEAERLGITIGLFAKPTAEGSRDAR